MLLLWHLMFSDWTLEFGVKWTPMPMRQCQKLVTGSNRSFVNKLNIFCWYFTSGRLISRHEYNMLFFLVVIRNLEWNGHPLYSGLLSGYLQGSGLKAKMKLWVWKRLRESKTVASSGAWWYFTFNKYMFLKKSYPTNFLTLIMMVKTLAWHVFCLFVCFAFGGQHLNSSWAERKFCHPAWLGSAAHLMAERNYVHSLQDIYYFCTQ